MMKSFVRILCPTPPEMALIYIKVCFIWICDTIHQALVNASVYSYAITEYGNTAYLAIIPT